jgi:hypothetical protein
MKDKNLLYISLLVLWPLILIFRVPFEKNLPLDLLFWMKIGAFFAFAFAIIQSIREGKRSLRIAGISLSILSFVFLKFDLSERLFLGNRIGEDYIAEAPGFIELMVYDRECTFGYGGIFGVTDIFYCNYEIENDTFWILTNERILELEGSIFKVKGRELEIRRKNVVQHGI